MFQRAPAKIVVAAKTAIPEEDVVCLLFDIDDVHERKASLGLQVVIADSKLTGAIPITAPEGNRLVCMPIATDELLSQLGEHEDVAELQKKTKASESLVLWVICCDGDNRTSLDIHTHRLEFN